MSNSPLISHTNISPHRTSPRNNNIDTITIHCVVGQCSVEALGQLFQTKVASSNYGIGTDGRIGMYVEEQDRSFCSGGYDKAGKPIRVNGISGGDNDHRAITIEVASDSFHPYAVNNKAYTSLINLCTDVCKRNNIVELKWKADKTLVGQIDKQNMTVHRWFAYKACPGDYLYERHGEIARLVNQRLVSATYQHATVPEGYIPTSNVPTFNPTENINNIGGINVSLEEFTALWLQMRKTLQDNDNSKWSQEARSWAINNGLVQGGSTSGANYMWEDVLTREQFITVLYRFAQLMGKA